MRVDIEELQSASLFNFIFNFKKYIVPQHPEMTHVIGEVLMNNDGEETYLFMEKGKTKKEVIDLLIGELEKQGKLPRK